MDEVLRKFMASSHMRSLGIEAIKSMYSIDGESPTIVVYGSVEVGKLSALGDDIPVQHIKTLGLGIVPRSAVTKSFHITQWKKTSKLFIISDLIKERNILIEDEKELDKIVVRMI